MAPPHITQTARKARREWPESLLWQAIGIKRFGGPYSAITKITGIPKSTLANAWARYEKTGQVKSTTRTGRPKITTVRDDRQLLIYSKRKRKITYEQLRRNFAANISVSTIKRRLVMKKKDIDHLTEKPSGTTSDRSGTRTWRHNQLGHPAMAPVACLGV